MFRCWTLLGLALATGACGAPKAVTVTIHVAPRPAATFVPSRAFGAGVDGMEQGDVAQVYTPANLRAMARAGYGPLTYRLRTELGVEAWHWNPEGIWSDARHRRGYWTSDAHSAAPLRLGYGYRLTHRGSTTDQANNDGFSRLDDDDPNTFWKSSPYLDQHFTGEDNARHPQWVVIDLGRRRPVDTVRLQWAVPYATRYRVEYWAGRDDAADGIDQTYEAGRTWRAFPQGAVTDGTGGDVRLRLCRRPVQARFVRLWMTQGRSPTLSRNADVRDGLGYALREVGVGLADRVGRFHDWVTHAPTHGGQTEITVSSTDPWHEASGRDPRVEQPGFDRVFRSPLTHDLPVLVPVGLLYDTPDNAAAELRFLLARGYSLRGVEMGEEPDGQYMTPEDYGALYVQWADALRRVAPNLPLGGPGYQTNVGGWTAWPDARGDRSWTHRFLRYLTTRGHLGELQFFSFEWYPFDDLGAAPAGQLLQEPGLLAHALHQLRREGLARGLPLLMTEYGYSAFAGQAEMDLPGALLNAEIVAQFLTLGGTSAYLYGLEPNTPIQEGYPTYGNLAVYLSDSARRIRFPLPTLYALRLLTGQWVMPGSTLPHTLYAAYSGLRDAAGRGTVTAYAVHRPDGQWAILLLNKAPKRPAIVRVHFDGAQGHFAPATLVQYSPAQYVWHAQKENGYPHPDRPPVARAVRGEILRLPPYSLSVVRGRLLPGGASGGRETRP